MNESEWLVSSDPAAMLAFTTGTDATPWNDPTRWQPKPSDRKLRLFDDACWEQFGLTIDDVAVDVSRCPGAAALLRDIVGNPWRPIPGDCHIGTLYVCEKCDHVNDRLRHCRMCGERDHLRKYRERDQWARANDGTVRNIAHTIYTERAFDRLPILGDALEDAGCTARGCIHCGYGEYINMNPPCGCSVTEMLLHLRGPGPHALGCWVLDILLGKE